MKIKKTNQKKMKWNNKTKLETCVTKTKCKNCKN